MSQSNRYTASPQDEYLILRFRATGSRSSYGTILSDEQPSVGSARVDCILENLRGGGHRLREVEWLTEEVHNVGNTATSLRV